MHRQNLNVPLAKPHVPSGRLFALHSSSLVRPALPGRPQRTNASGRRRSMSTCLQIYFSSTVFRYLFSVPKVNDESEY
jgi:hypothetical protein